MHQPQCVIGAAVGRPGRITPMLAKRIGELAALKWTASRICADLGGVVSRQAIDAHLQKTTKGPPRGSVDGAPMAPQTPPVQLAGELAAVLGPSEEVGLVDVERRLRRTSRLADTTEAAIADGQLAPGVHVAVVNLETNLAERVEAMRPRPPPDPEDDPVNQEATRKLMARLDKTLAEAERSGQWVSKRQE